MLLYGPPGLGKTTLANIIANELGAHFQPTSGPTLQIKGDLTAIITNLQDKQVLFIDEVHRLQPVAGRDCSIRRWKTTNSTSSSDKGLRRARTRLEVKPFTFIGATTRAGLISGSAAVAFRHRAAAGVLYATKT